MHHQLVLLGVFSLAEELSHLCQSSCRAVNRKGFLISYLIDTNPNLTWDQTQVPWCMSQTRWPHGHMLFQEPLERNQIHTTTDKTLDNNVANKHTNH